VRLLGELDKSVVKRDWKQGLKVYLLENDLTELGSFEFNSGSLID
jgi:hypothetical protein